MAVTFGGVFNKYMDVYTAYNTEGELGGLSKSRVRKSGYDVAMPTGSFGDYRAPIMREGDNFLTRSVLWLRDSLFKSFGFGKPVNNRDDDYARLYSRISQTQPKIIALVITHDATAPNARVKIILDKVRSAHENTKTPLRSKLVYDCLKELAGEVENSGNGQRTPGLAKAVFFPSREY